MDDEQHGVLTYAQAQARGITRSAIANHLVAGRWQRLQRATFLTHSGPISRHAAIWAVVLAAGRGAIASHATAAELVGLSDEVKPLINITVPGDRRIARLNDATVHYSARAEAARHPSRRPPQTRVEETVLDLADRATSLDEALGWMAKACGRRLSTPERLAAALGDRKRARWRGEMGSALADIGRGNHSVLELRYVRDVERAHRLPTGIRQAPHERSGGRIYDDVWYAAFRTVVELDGRAAHPIDSRHRDLVRDNIAGERGDTVLHFGWAEIAATPCATALQVARALRSRGWPGTPRRCGESCMIR